MKFEGLLKITFWKVVAVVLMAAGLVSAIQRFAMGLGATTNLLDTFPWGIWIGVDILVGVGLAAGGFAIAATVYIFNLERFRPILRPTILTAFLGYVLVICGLMVDLGRPWAIWHAIIMWNPHSVMFEVAWCVMLYTTVLALEFSPVVLEHFRLHRALKVVKAITIPLVVLGVVLSTLHQSSLGSLFLIIPSRMHPLWYSNIIPFLFIISCVAAGLAMTIFESFISSRAFGREVELPLLSDIAKVVVVVLGLYFTVRMQVRVPVVLPERHVHGRDRPRRDPSLHAPPLPEGALEQDVALLLLHARPPGFRRPQGQHRGDQHGTVAGARVHPVHPGSVDHGRTLRLRIPGVRLRRALLPRLRRGTP